LQVSLVSNGTITADCNAGGIPLTMNALGYFSLTTACTGNLTIHNSETVEVLFTALAPTTILYTAQLNRFVYPTIRLVRTKTITAESVLSASVYVNDTVNGNLTYDSINNWCVPNGTMIVCTITKAIHNPS
jgi:hypothetical protein